MNQFIEWLAMGGYYLYVWPAYGLVCGILLMNVFAMKYKQKHTCHTVHQWFNLKK